MKPEDFQKLTTQIAQNLNDQAKVTDLLTQLSDAYSTTFTTNETLTAKTEEYENQVKGLQETNMKLFLKQGQPVETEKLNSTDPLKYEDLLTDLGGNE